MGQIGSCAVSPALGPIALALVRREAEPGTSVVVGGAMRGATVLELPFSTAPEQRPERAGCLTARRTGGAMGVR